MHPLAIAGFFSALAVAQAIIAAYALLLHQRPAPRAPDSRTPRRRGGELLVFGMLGLAVTALDGGLARALVVAPDARAPSLAVAGMGRVAAAALLVHFVVAYARTPRAGWLLAGAYGVSVPLLITAAIGRGVLLVAVSSAVGAAIAIALLGSAFVRGQREVAGFAGLALLFIATVFDALRDAGVIDAPPLGPLGYAAFTNGVIVTQLARFTELRGQLESRARELKDRARALSRAYDELRAAQDELVRKEQLAAVGELSAVVAHEVRNPLAIITNAVATLRRTGVGEDDRATLLGILDEETTRLNRLVGDLLRYARPVNLERQLVSLRDLVERGMQLADGKVHLTAELVEPAPTEKIWADPNLLRQVIDNLIDNAIQAMSGGGVLTVTLVNEELDGARGVEIQIQDTGEGMDTEVRARALDPFFTTRPSGTGLGLAIVARIIDAHGGVLRIKSKAGAGTVMHVFLPISAEPPPRSRASDAGRHSSEPPLPGELNRLRISQS